MESNIRILRRGKAADVEGLLLIPLCLGGEASKKALISLLHDIWNEVHILLLWDEWLIVSISKEDKCSDCTTHRGIRFISMAAKVLTFIVLHRLAPVRKGSTRKQQARFFSG